MKKTGVKAFILKDGMLLALAVTAAIGSLFFYSSRTCFIFMDIYTFNGMAQLLVWLSIINASVTTLMYILKANGVKIKGRDIGETKGFTAIYIISLVITIFFIIFVAVNFIISGAETSPVNLRNLKERLPFASAVIVIMLLAILLPGVEDRKLKTGISLFTLAATLVLTVMTLYPCYPYKITSDPMVIDNGKNYVVVFSTNDTGTGYVKYSYQDKDFVIYDQNNGRLKGDSKIHSIEIPKEHLIANTYSVGSKRVIDELSYGGRQGKEVVSDSYTFNVPVGSDQTYLTVSDWHAHLKFAYDAIDLCGDDYNGVILIGDCAPGLMYEDEVKKYLVEFGGKVSGGVMPVIYIRGNHETRGKIAGKLAEYLKLDEFYFTTSYGDYDFLILDSGEDKPDNHPEYGGMVDYEKERTDMVNKMASLPVSEKKHITLVHDYKICVEENLRHQAYRELRRIGTRQIICGHTHIVKFFEEEGIRVYMDGGIHNAKSFVASKLTLNKDGYKLEAWESTGEKVAEESFSW